MIFLLFIFSYLFGCKTYSREIIISIFMNFGSYILPSPIKLPYVGNHLASAHLAYQLIFKS